MKAIALISGGLDSILAAKTIKEQGVETVTLNFKIPFCQSNKKNSSENKGIISFVGNNLGEELKVIDISEDFLELLKNPKHGFGSNLNPCIDCKIFMLTKAKELMKQFNASFVITGEVLGQRPMSQYRQALEKIERESGLEGLLLRPLSAKLLPETIPEKEHWIERSKLLAFNGRSRKPQIELAKKFNLHYYPNAAGGCLLTDPEFTKRLKELINHQELNLDNVELLKIGRHFRISPKTKLVVGRNEGENKELENLTKEGDYLFLPTEEVAGPTSLGRGEFSEELIRFSCAVTCHYCDLDGAIEEEIVYKRIGEDGYHILKVSPLEENQLKALRI